MKLFTHSFNLQAMSPHLSRPTQKILLFLLLTFCLSAICYYFLTQDQSNDLFGLGLIASPAISAILTQLLIEKTIGGLGWSSGLTSFTLLSYAIPLIYGLIVYVITWFTGLGGVSVAALYNQVNGHAPNGMYDFSSFLASYVFKTATLGVLFSCVTAFGEELGWRGLLVPELAKKFSFTFTALFSGGIWALWHYPAILLLKYNNPDAPLLFEMICFTLLAINVSFILAWLRLKSRSVWPAVLLHASHNTFIQTLLDPLTVKHHLTPYVTGEFGIGLTIITALLAFFAFHDRRNLLLLT